MAVDLVTGDGGDTSEAVGCSLPVKSILMCIAALNKNVVLELTCLPTPGKICLKLFQVAKHA